MSRVTITIEGVEYPMFHTMRHTVEMQRAGFAASDLVQLKDNKRPATDPDNIIGVNLESWLLSAYWLIKGAVLREGETKFPYTPNEFIDVAPDNIIDKLIEVTTAMQAKVPE